MKCPLCDGAVVNGRCRDCGMPYRNDEVLYHLNEDRRSHEKHATDKAKEELLKRMVPLGDTVKQASGQKAGKNAQKTSGKPVQKSVTRTTAQTVKNRQKAAARSKKEFGKSSNSSWSSEKKSKKKKSPGRIIFWVLTALVILGPSVEELFSSRSDSEGRMEYGLNAGYGSIEVGDELPAGEYRIYTNNDEIKLLYKQADEKKAEVFELKESDSLEMLLVKGDILKLDGDGDSYKSVYFKELDR